jgi:hypothetical protein
MDRAVEVVVGDRLDREADDPEPLNDGVERREEEVTATAPR